jgi:hypothetical protein
MAAAGSLADRPYRSKPGTTGAAALALRGTQSASNTAP